MTRRASFRSIAGADLLVVVGCKLGEIATKRFQPLPPETPIVHLDILAEEIGRTSRADVPLWGDARAGLEDLAAALAGDAPRARAARADLAAEVPARMRRWVQEARTRLESDERPINMARLIHELNRAMPADGILVADGGFAGHWTGPPLRHEVGGTPLRRRSRRRLDRLRTARIDGRAGRRAASVCPSPSSS